MDAATAYFLKKYYPHVIKWWLVMYNPEAFRIWPSKAEEEEALRLEAEEKELLAIEDKESKDAESKDSGMPGMNTNTNTFDETAFNATTGSYSGLYGQKPVDADTQAALDAILNATSHQNSIDSLVAGAAPQNDVVIPPEQDEIIKEANEIYERLLREAAEDEAKKQAEIDEMRKEADAKFAQQ